jgi:hypothetical protein
VSGSVAAGWFANNGTLACRRRWHCLPLTLGFYLLLAACSSVPVAVCPPLKTYTPEFNQRLAGELEAMPADSATIEAIGDYIGLRDQIRACQ